MEEHQRRNDILQTLLDMRSGAVAMDISAKFDEMIQAVLGTGGKGELIIKLRAAPSKLGMGGAVLEIETEHECKMKKPELAVGKSLFFVTKDGILTSDDPAQEDMFNADSKRMEVKQ